MLFRSLLKNGLEGSSKRLPYIQRGSYCTLAMEDHAVQQMPLLQPQCEVAEDREQDKVDEVLLEGWEPRDIRTLVIIDISGVYQLIVSWCCCPGAPNHATQLFQHRLFPASTSRPSTAFTFAVLEYFHVDAVECKTSASNFFNKLCRLTDFSSPQSVPVSKTYMTCNFCLTHPRISIVN